MRRIAPAPCTQACPAGVQVKAYVSLIAEERFGEALEVVRRRCPLPGICVASTNSKSPPEGVHATPVATPARALRSGCCRLAFGAPSTL